MASGRSDRTPRLMISLPWTPPLLEICSGLEVERGATVRRNGARSRPLSLSKMELLMGNNKDPNEKQPGEKGPGKFHYNPGNMSGKEIGIRKKSAEQVEADKKKNRPAQEDGKV